VPNDPGIDSKHKDIGSLFMVASKPDAGQAPAKASGSR
jgi:hypothetical protein